ncbi:MAG TPA: HEPN domain-containing protein [Kofleriaceae bacterium]|nr:HEPN domain-containing protein [Kofleriaceae bacterium]
MSTVVVSEEWRVQALRDLDVAKHLAAGGYYEWASYASQQAAEKAIKAVRYSMAIDLHVADDKKKEDKNKRDFTHSLPQLAEPLRQLWPTMLPTEAALFILTKHEADGRYPSVRAGPYAAPSRVYDQATADNALQVAELIVNRCTALVADLHAFWTGRPH